MDELQSRGTQLLSGLERVLGPDRGPCAVLLYRDYSNVGDAAIWFSQDTLLRKLGFTISYAATRGEFDFTDLRHRADRGPIVISGGGSLGTQWPKTHAFKEMVIQEFPERPIFIFPQSGHFDDANAAERFGEIARRHSRLKIIARDLATLQELSDLGCIVELLPDLAMGLWDYPPIRRGGPGEEGPCYLMRRDAEASGLSGPSSSTDWRDPPSVRWLRRIENRIVGRRTVALSRENARRRLNHGIRLLSGSSTVVTDRLHGLVLANLLGIRVVVLDNSWGKVRRFYDSWYSSDESVIWAESMGEAKSLVE